MKTWFELLVHDLRNAGTSLGVAAFLTVACLVVLHGTAAGPIQTATALPLLWCLCALLFASDSFATDLASGRLATRATLPVCARSLWSAKLAGFAASLSLIVGLGITLEGGWQWISGGEKSLTIFLGALPPPGKTLTVVALIGSAGMLCSLMVESALTAMLLAGLVLGALWGLSLAALETVKVTGPNTLTENPSTVAVAIAGALLFIGLLAFTRAQRKLGDSAVRVRTVLIGALVLVLGLAGTVTATSMRWSTYGLKDRRLDIFPPIASPDGRFIAFEAAPSGGARDVRLPSVWVLDLETREHHLLAGPGQLTRNAYNDGWKSWTEENGLCVLAQDRWLWTGKPESLRMRAINAELHQESIEDLPLVGAPRLPDWAIVKETRTGKARVRSVYMGWKGKEIERTFEGVLGRDVFVSPTPGRIILRRDKSLVLFDFESGEERALIGGEVGYTSLSPDSRALLVRTQARETHVLSMTDGSLLHAVWTRDDSHNPGWIQGDDRSHMLQLSPMKRWSNPRILDLDTGREFEVDDSMNWFFARVADRGYVMIDELGNLVWIDREGKLVKVLIDRGGRRN